MSMISGQIDRLRTAAQTYRKMGNHTAENMLLDAADTITELRDDLQRANSENAKLRELVRDLYHLSDTYFEEREPYWWKPYEQRMRELGIEVDG